MTGSRLILLVEDDENDVFFMRRAWKKSGVSAPIQIVRDGQEAIDYLAGVSRFSDREKFPLPSLVILDLKLPFVGGLDVLAWLRSQSQFEKLPVVILTSSDEERDRERAAQFNAQGYFVKPPTPEMIRDAVESLTAADVAKN